MYIAFILLLILIILLGIEKFRLDRNIQKIKIRILVNGTRGKSTVVKYIAALLRQNEIKTFSKITGIVPTFAGPDGQPQIIKRRGGARVIEQLKMISEAARLNADAIVLECMSINPELQKLESRLLKPHFYIITNIREDHLEDMGKTPAEWAQSICSAIPEDTKVLTTETKHLETIKMYAEEIRSNVIHIDKIDLMEIAFDQPGIIKENFEIALALAKELKLKTSEFLEETLKQEEQSADHQRTINNCNVNFYNGFAINDVYSAEVYLKQINKKTSSNNKLVIIFNSRADRPMRSLRFAEMISKTKPDKCILTGDHQQATKRKLLKLGIKKENVIRWSTKQSKMVSESLKKVVDADTTLIGFGNIKGDGFEILNSLNKN